MTFGVIMLVHNELDRAQSLIRHWHSGGVPVVVHVDKIVRSADMKDLQQAVADVPNVIFCDRYRCEWGTWGIVEATLAASELLLQEFPDLGHVFMASGSCLPLRPISELTAYLEARQNTNFIESATTRDVPWIVDGLSAERFSLSFPFSWRQNRFLFDRFVCLQQKLKFKRKAPEGLNFHMGSQWWCLTQTALRQILNHPRRAEFDKFFKKVWIPDESYFQTIVRLLGVEIESQSLTYSRFACNGKPHIFYDDHFQILRRSKCFVARKVWGKTDYLWDKFLNIEASDDPAASPNPAALERVFDRAALRRSYGRPGLVMAGRFPDKWREKRVTAAPYAVFEGFSDLFVGFEEWCGNVSNMTVHGHIFGPNGAEFANRSSTYNGALSACAKLRDYNAEAFLKNFIWNTRGQKMCFQYGPADCKDVSWVMAEDANARINVIAGAWLLGLTSPDLNFDEVRARAAKYQKIESDHLQALRSPYARAQIKIWTIAEFLEAPSDFLRKIFDELGENLRDQERFALPKVANLEPLPELLRKLKNSGMHPYLIGDLPSEPNLLDIEKTKIRKSYVVK